MYIFDVVFVAAKNLLSLNVLTAVYPPVLLMSIVNIASPLLSVVAAYVLPLDVRITLAPYIGRSDFDFSVAVIFFVSSVLYVLLSTVSLED